MVEEEEMAAVDTHVEFKSAHEEEDIESEAECASDSGDSEEEEEAKKLTCPSCKHENKIETLPHKCGNASCTYLFRQTKHGFVADGFVVDDKSESSAEVSTSEEEFDFDEEDSEEEEDSDEESFSEEEENGSDEEWVPKAKKRRV